MWKCCYLGRISQTHFASLLGTADYADYADCFTSRRKKSTSGSNRTPVDPFGTRCSLRSFSPLSRLPLLAGTRAGGRRRLASVPHSSVYIKESFVLFVSFVVQSLRILRILCDSAVRTLWFRLRCFMIWRLGFLLACGSTGVSPSRAQGAYDLPER